VRQLLGSGLADGAHRLPPGDAIDDDCTVPKPGLPSLPHGICIIRNTKGTGPNNQLRPPYNRPRSLPTCMRQMVSFQLAQ